MRFSVRLFFAVFLFLISLFIFRTTSLAQVNYKQSQIQQYITPDVDPNVPKNLNTLSQSILMGTLSSLTCALGGVNVINPKEQCLGFNNATGKIGFVQNNGGVIGIMVPMITALYNPPIQTADYVRYLASNFGLAKGAYAQTGVGFDSLKPIQNLWILFRNITYLFFVVIFILIGLGIMLRAHIDPRTVMTVQNQIPKIVIGLILITFSVAIAGFLIDLMWIFIFILFDIFSRADPKLAEAIKPQSYLTTFSFSDIFGGFFAVARDTTFFVGNGIFNTTSGFSSQSVTSVILPSATNQCTGFDILCYAGQLFSATIGAALGAVLGLLIGTIVGGLVFLVVIIAVIYSLFKLWFELLKAYISILIDIIFAPFWIVAGLIPGAGQSVGFGAWIRDISANLMAFPTTIALFFLAKIFYDGFSPQNSNCVYNNLFTPPLVGSVTNGCGIFSPNFGAVIAFGIILMSPNIVKTLKAMFKAQGIGGVGEGVNFALPIAGVGYRRFGAGLSRAGNNQYGAGPLRQLAMGVLTTRPTNIFRGQRWLGTTNPTEISVLADQAKGRTRIFSRARLAQKLSGTDEKQAVPSSKPGGP